MVLEGGKLSRESIFKLTEPTPTVAIGFDTEDDSKGNCHLLIFTINEHDFIFDNAAFALFWLIYSDFGCDATIWCVNTEYDLNNLTKHFDFLIDRLYNKSRFIFGKLYRPKGVVRFCDLVNFYSLSAAEVGKLHGLEKLSFVFKHKYNADGSIIVTQKEIDYCIRDAKICEVAGTFVMQKLTDLDIKPTATVASAAMQIYLRHYDTGPIRNGNNERYQVDPADVYQAYYGGRVEVFKYGGFKQKLRYFDVNSLYPFVMKQFLYPDPSSGVRERKSADIENGIIYARVKAPDVHIPILPVRHNGKLIFPTGTFEGVWTVPEFDMARRNGYKIQKVYWSFEWSKTVDLFSQFVTDFYQARQQAETPADNKFYKVIMNSLYGKFAERRIMKWYVPLQEAPALSPVVYGMGVVEETQLPQHNHTILSAYVTAYGRCVLWSYMMQCEEGGGQVFYCDTDSIICAGSSPKNIGTELGQMKLESTITEAEFLGPKYYRYKDAKAGWHYVCKGVPTYCQADMFDKGVARYKKPIRYQESIRRHLQANVWLDTEKKSLTRYDKRTILKHGNTAPIML